MDSIRFAEYRNQQPGELADDIFDTVIDHDNDIMQGYSYPMPVAEFVLQAVRHRSGWPAGVMEWERSAKDWIPAQVQSWWYEQFDKNPEVDGMSAEWWQTQALGLVAAWYDDQPVGAVALARIYARDRGLQTSPDQPLFNEIRGLVVDPHFRGHKIGTRLVRRIVSMGVQLQDNGPGPLATIAITSNPLAAKMFRACGAVDKPAEAGIPLSAAAARTSACWRQWQSHNWPETERCNTCPVRKDQLWLWPTKAG